MKKARTDGNLARACAGQCLNGQQRAKPPVEVDLADPGAAEHLGRSEKKVIVAITRKMGSIEENTSGGAYIYRSSKAALNAAVKSLAIDLAPRGIVAAVLHPGWVKTDMGGPNALITVEQSVTGLRKVIGKLALADSGKFFSYDGAEIAW